jgi:chromosome segregation ATPase
MAVRDRIMNTYQNKKARPDESEIEVENLRRRLNQAEEQIRSNERRFQKAEEEGRFLERGYINTYNKLMEKHLKLAEINAENNVLHNRIERFRVLSQSLLSGE